MSLDPVNTSIDASIKINQTQEKPSSLNLAARVALLPVAGIAYVSLLAVKGGVSGLRSLIAPDNTVSYQDKKGETKAAFLPEQRLVESRNFVSPSTKKQPEQTKSKKVEDFVTNQLRTQGVNQEVSLASKKSKALLTEGLCQGMVTDMAARLIKKDQNPDPISFEDNLKKIAEKYEEGAHSKAVANQLLYRLLPNIKANQFALEYIENLERNKKLTNEEAHCFLLLFNATASDPNQIDKAHRRVVVAQEWKEAGVSPQADNLNQILSHLPEIFTPQGINEEAFKRYVTGGQDESLLKLLYHLRELHVAVNKPNVLKPEYQLVTVSKSIQHQISPLSADPKIQELKHKIPTQLTLINENQKANLAAKARNIELESLEGPFGLAGDSSDEDYLLSKLDKVPNGYSEMVFKTGGQDHTALLIRNQDDFYVWDPNQNYGLLKMNKPGDDFSVVGNHLKDYLNSYGGPDLEDNHSLQLKQFKPRDA